MGGFFRRLGRALNTRPTVTASGVGVEETPTSLDYEHSATLPGGEVPEVPEQRRLAPVSSTAQGAPAWVSGLGDFLTALGAGPEQARRQQMMREQNLQGLAQQSIAPQHAAAEAVIQQRRLRAMELEEDLKLAPKTIISETHNMGFQIDPRSGKVTKFDLTDPEAIRLHIENGINKIVNPAIRGQAAEAANGRLAAKDINGAFKALDNAIALDQQDARDKQRPKVAGTDVPFPADVEAQKRRLAQAGKSAPEDDRNKRLTPAEAKAWGVPGGTTRGELEGKMPPEKPQLSSKDTLVVKGKLNNLNLAKIQLSKVRENFGKAKGSIGPIAGALPTPTGQAYDKSVDALRQTVIGLTRTPGIGAMSDFESRLAISQMPDRTAFQYEGTVNEAINNLDSMIKALDTGYRDMLAGETPGGASDDAAPKTGETKKNSSGDTVVFDGTKWVLK